MIQNIEGHTVLKFQKCNSFCQLKQKLVESEKKKFLKLTFSSRVKYKLLRGITPTVSVVRLK